MLPFWRKHNTVFCKLTDLQKWPVRNILGRELYFLLCYVIYLTALYSCFLKAILNSQSNNLKLAAVVSADVLVVSLLLSPVSQQYKLTKHQERSFFFFFTHNFLTEHKKTTFPETEFLFVNFLKTNFLKIWTKLNQTVSVCLFIIKINPQFTD